MLQKHFGAANSYLIKANLKVKNIWFFIYFYFVYLDNHHNIQLPNKTSLKNQKYSVAYFILKLISILKKSVQLVISLKNSL